MFLIILHFSHYQTFLFKCYFRVVNSLILKSSLQIKLSFEWLLQKILAEIWQRQGRYSVWKIQRKNWENNNDDFWLPIYLSFSLWSETFTKILVWQLRPGIRTSDQLAWDVLQRPLSLNFQSSGRLRLCNNLFGKGSI